MRVIYKTRIAQKMKRAVNDAYAAHREIECFVLGESEYNEYRTYLSTLSNYSTPHAHEPDLLRYANIPVRRSREVIPEWRP